MVVDFMVVVGFFHCFGSTLGSPVFSEFCWCFTRALVLQGCYKGFVYRYHDIWMSMLVGACTLAYSFGAVFFDVGSDCIWTSSHLLRDVRFRI